VLTVEASAKLSGFTATSKDLAANIPMTNSSYIVNGTINPCCEGTTLFNYSYANMGGKNVTINKGGKLEVMAGIVTRTTRNAACLTNVGTLTMRDGSIISLSFHSLFNPAEKITSESKPDVYTIFEAKSLSIGDVILDLPDLSQYSDHLYYDCSQIKNGIISVCYREATGIKPIGMDEQVTVEVISTSGVTMMTYQSTYSAVKSNFRNIPIPQGMYILRVSNDKGSRQTMTIRK
jgi:hypothetical protein